MHIVYCMGLQCVCDSMGDLAKGLAPWRAWKFTIPTIPLTATQCKELRGMGGLEWLWALNGAKTLAKMGYCTFVVL